MYEKYPKTCISICILCILAYIFTPEKGMKVSISEVSAKEAQTATGKTASGVSVEIQNWRKEDSKKESNSWASFTGTKLIQWVHENNACDADCKVKTLVKLGMAEKIAWSLVYTCKEKASDPRHCIIAGSSILKSESNFGNKCNWYNCFGMGGWSHKYKSYEHGAEDFVMRYNKYWWKAKSAWYFYPPKWWVSPSRYCTSEHSFNSSIWCPNWRKHASYIWDKLNKIF